MGIKLFLLKLSAKKGRRQAVRYVQNLGNVSGLAEQQITQSLRRIWRHEK